MRSIRSALVLRLWLSWLGLLLVTGSVLWLLLRTSFTREFDLAQEARAQAIATLVVARGDSIEFDFADEIMPEFSRVEEPEYFELFREDGTPFERSVSLGERNLSLPPPGTDGSGWNVRLPDGRPGRALAMRFTPQLGDESLEEAREHAASRGSASPMTLVLARDGKAIAHVMSAVTLWVLLAGLALALISVVLVRQTVASGLRPLGHFSEAVQALSLSSLRTDRLSTPLPIEVEPVRVRLVETLQRLSEAFEREKRFTASAAHELRTPIAELKSIAQYALKWPEEPANAGKTNQEVLRLALRMEQLVSTLLSIARSADAEVALPRESIRLARLVNDVRGSLDARARARGLTWDLAIPSPVVAHTNAPLLESLLGNLLENAVSHAREGTPIRIEAHQRAAALELVVRNACDGLAPEDVAHAREPFWRRPQTGSEGTHAGLGLTLAAAIADALPAELELELEEKTIFVARVSLPLS